MTLDGVIAGARTTDDGHADPSGICNALAIGAKNMGAKIVRKNRVTGLTQLPSGEWDVETEKGTVRAEIVVNAAGCYARQVAQMAGIDIPVTNMEHHYVVTDPIPAFKDREEEIPVMRCPHVSGYFRQEQKSGLIGVYEIDRPRRSLGAARRASRMGFNQRAVPRRSGADRALAGTRD